MAESPAEESMASPAKELQPEAAPIARVLPPEEFGRLLGLQGFETQLPDPRWTKVVVVEVAGEIVAFSPVWLAVHTEPIWIRPEFRKKPGIVRRLWNGIRGLLEDISKTYDGGLGAVAYATIYKTNEANVLPMALRLGFLEVPGSLYMLDLKEKP